jgi:hypothetical protein
MRSLNLEAIQKNLSCLSLFIEDFISDEKKMPTEISLPRGVLPYVGQNFKDNLNFFDLGSLQSNSKLDVLKKIEVPLVLGRRRFKQHTVYELNCPDILFYLESYLPLIV